MNRAAANGPTMAQPSLLRAEVLKEAQSPSLPYLRSEGACLGREALAIQLPRSTDARAKNRPVKTPASARSEPDTVPNRPQVSSELRGPVDLVSLLDVPPQRE